MLDFWVYVDGDLKVRDKCHITGKYRGSAHRDCNIKFKLEVVLYCIVISPIVFHNIKKVWFTSYYARTRQIRL